MSWIRWSGDKAGKVESLVALWIKNLRQQASIEVRPDCLNK